MRPASSRIVSLAIGFLRHLTNGSRHFAPSLRRSTSKARLFNLAEALSRSLRRRDCRIVLRSRFSSHLRVTSDVVCSHSFSFRCSINIAAMSAQCGTSRLAAGAVRPMVDSASDAESWNCSRKGSLANNSVFYRTRFDDKTQPISVIIEILHHKIILHDLKRNKSHGFGAVHLKEIIKTNHVQLKSRISRQRIDSFLRMTEG